MDIKLKLYQPFMTAWNRMKEKYGDQFERINGFHNDNLNFSDFIDHFTESTTVADATIDSNANSSTHDIRTLMSDMTKPHTKLLAFNKIFYELSKAYGVKAAETWLEQEWNGAYYLHDATSASFVPYCFSGETKAITDKGNMRLDELVGKDVKVLNKNREWEDATVKCFGEAQLWELTLERLGIEKKIFATANHYWFVCDEDGSNIREDSQMTKDLLPGTFIPYNTMGQGEEENKSWCVVSVEPTDRYEDVYCAVVNGTHSFTLDNNILTGNCFAYDVESIVNRGLFFINKFKTQPPKHLTTYNDHILEFISWASNRSSGAVGLPSYLVYSYYFWYKDTQEGFYLKDPEYYRRQCFQKFVYDLNQPYLRITECA